MQSKELAKKGDLDFFGGVGTGGLEAEQEKFSSTNVGKNSPCSSQSLILNPQKADAVDFLKAAFELYIADNLADPALLACP